MADKLAFPSEGPRPDDDELRAAAVASLNQISAGFRDLETAISVTGSKVNPVDEVLGKIGPRLGLDPDQTFGAYVGIVRELMDDQAISLIPDVTVKRNADGGIEAEPVPFQPLVKIADATEFLLNLIGSEIGYERKRDILLPLFKAAHAKCVAALRHLPRGETPRRRMLRDCSHLLNLFEDTCANYIDSRDRDSDEVTIGFFTDGKKVVHPIRIRKNINR